MSEIELQRCYCCIHLQRKPLEHANRQKGMLSVFASLVPLVPSSPHSILLLIRKMSPVFG